jgi:hypothetical protein
MLPSLLNSSGQLTCSWPRRAPPGISNPILTMAVAQLARRFVVVQIAIGFGDQDDRFVVLPPEDRSRYRLAERIRKLMPMVTAKDSRRFHECRASVGQARAACSPLSGHRSSCNRPQIAGRPTSVVGRGLSQGNEV